jgi:hypothetical protein
MKRWAAALGPLAVVCFLTACSSSATGTSPTSPGSFASEADQVVANLAAGNFAAVEGRFDPAIMKAAQAMPLQKGWAACQDVMGTYRSHGAPMFARKGQFDLEQVPVTWANGPDAVIITFNPNGTIAGLQACKAAGGIGEPLQ